ncbi:hypothetical protein ONS95_001755 [Cadophora gregata]|uniref:uncharacterized protein n=1 Tax=Cadophora gregata TaxID=51156 RepID=UPI0026DDCBE1|nr:uncharacterized protein ONS95_001755 [Cadophora gregata]KAK0111394.1 hypothetical protein ONS95_001755 [Cadophora gregata]KAK0112129.1 hypothetical protein ONS96_001387 [Cadophora gregata f. sp. sojae]
MPTTLPVPSKGALRALRKLALGTSCTIAFGAGLLTEDRRRRIHSAREVHENAKKLKSSRKYHSAGTTSLEALEGQTLQYRDAAFWLPSNVLKSTASAVLGPSEDSDCSRTESPTEDELPTELSDIPKFTPPHLRVAKTPPLNERRPPLGPRTSEMADHPKRQAHNRQRKLAHDVNKLLAQSPPNVDEATALFFDSLEERLLVDKSGLSQLMIDASVHLSKACQLESMFASSARILDIILGYGPINEEDFWEFRPLSVIRSLISVEGERDHPPVDPERLGKACSIYLTTFREKPKSMSSDVRLLGWDLCKVTCQQGMFDLTLAVFSRLESCRAGESPIAVDCLLKATHGKGHHKKIFRHFQRLYTQTRPDQTQFFQVLSLVIDSMLVLGKLEQAEQVLHAANVMAEGGDLDMSTTWFLKVLGEEYRTHRDLVRLQALFRRLQPLYPRTRHPQALYGAMIQFCVESRDEELASSYYRELRESIDPRPEDLRIYGHFALAKAHQGDWEGVKADFHKMKKIVPEDDEVYSNIFTPILKEYANSHSIDEIEDFVQYFLVRFHLRTNSLIMNAMIDVYSKVHEVDAISRWIAYATADGYLVRSTTFNAILRNCALHFQFSFDECFKLYCLVQELGSDVVDNNSLRILRNVAMSRSPNDATRNERLQKLKHLDDPVHISGSNEVYRAMTATSAQGNHIAVLKIYKRAQLDHVYLEAKHLNLAVRASLFLHGPNVIEAVRLIRDSQGNGMMDVTNAIASVFVHQMSDLYEDGSQVDTLAELADRTICSFEECKMKVPQKVITHTASVLQRRGRNRMAIDLWDSMSRRLNIPSSSFDLASLTTLLKAYIGLRDGHGVRWVFQNLVFNKLSPDAQLKSTVKEARREVRKQLNTNPNSERLHDWWTMLDEAYQEVKGMRQEALLKKEEIKIKVIKIMETAIEDHAIQGCTVKAEPQGHGQEGCQEKGVDSWEAGGNWVDLDTEMSHRPERLVSAVGS